VYETLAPNLLDTKKLLLFRKRSVGSTSEVSWLHLRQASMTGGTEIN
jgi:hypothetical protein